ncbi:MAG TPA: alkaline phosphatase family protein [Acidimicrobiales bacterium]|nr:alkaline phosphatase family protein [Acidimicrobiales bacterium]
MTAGTDPVTPAPVVPAFDGPCIANVVPLLLGVAHGAPGAAASLPAWMPPPVGRANQLVLLVIDGLGWQQLRARASLAPTLAGAAGGPVTSVAPSTTAAALTSLTTGLPPAVHGVVGYRVRSGQAILNVLSWRLAGADARRLLPPRTFQPHPTFPVPGHLRSAPTPVVSKVDYATTGFTAAHLGDAVLHGLRTPSGLVVEVRRLLAGGAPFVYAYYDGIDRVAHAHGLGDHYDAELRAADRLVADLLDALPPGAVLAVTADHGQVDVGTAVEVLGADLMDGVQLLSGEGRFRWLHVRPGAADDVAEAAAAAYGHLAWVRTREQMIDDGWLGGEPVPAVADRLGDVVLAPFAPTAFLDPADTGEQRLVARHGSLTEAEMLVPLVAWRPNG